MSIKTQYSRISHHTLTETNSPQLDFTVPASEDFTDGTWSLTDLALSEFGVKEDTKELFIRIDDEIIEVQLAGGPAPIVSTLNVTTTTYNITGEVEMYFIDATSNNITVNLPSPTDGLKLIFKRTDTTSNVVTIDGGVNTIDDNLTRIMLSHDSLSIIGNGTSWWII